MAAHHLPITHERLPCQILPPPSLSELTREVFGPVLHLVRYRRRDLGALLGQINATGYGLTLGVHTRIDETIHQVIETANAGNMSVNRNMVGAVVGAGHAPEPSRQPAAAAIDALSAWASQGERAGLAGACLRFKGLARSGQARALTGPTGERNVYTLLPRHGVLCLADDDRDRLTQLAAVLAVGSSAIWPATEGAQVLLAGLPAAVRQHVLLVREGSAPTVERSLSVNTAAAGGNASLMTIG